MKIRYHKKFNTKMFLISVLLVMGLFLSSFPALAVTPAPVSQLKITTNSELKGQKIVPGQIKVPVYSFDLEALGEDIELNKIEIGYRLSGLDNINFYNLSLVDGTGQISKTVASWTGDSIILGTDFVIVENTKSTVTLLLNTSFSAMSMLGETFSFYVKGVDAFGKKSGLNVKVRGKAYGYANTLVSGELTVSLASDSPSGGAINPGSDIPIMKFDLNASNEDIQLKKIKFEYDGSDDTQAINSLSLVEDGKVIKTAYVQGGTDNKYAEFYNPGILIEADSSKTIDVVAEVITFVNENESFNIQISELQGVTQSGTIVGGDAEVASKTFVVE